MLRKRVLYIGVFAIALIVLLGIVFSYGNWFFPKKGSVRNLTTGLSYSSIQSAIDASNTVDGNRILIGNGIFYEHINVYKEVILMGEDKESTIIDGGGTGTVVQVSASNIEISNLTIRHAANPAWQGKGFPDSCISANQATNLTIQNSIFSSASVCTWIYSSHNITVSRSLFSNASTMGLIFRSSSDSAAIENTVIFCGLVGIHLDGESTNCQVSNNSIIDCSEGIELEKSGYNLVNQNQLLDNNISLILNNCGYLNVFRENNMSGQQKNLVVWGSADYSFIQDIDSSNIVDGKAVYYMTNLQNRTIDLVNAPNAGYLALVNCTNVTVRDILLSNNKDGVLFAESDNCTLNDIRIYGDEKAIKSVGLTFFQSNNNSLTNSEVVNNSMGICFCLSNGNAILHDSFVGNVRQIVSNFSGLFSSATGEFSSNKWDNGVEGNYWGDYLMRYPSATEVNSTGTGNTPYIIDSSNVDSHPLMTNPQ